MEVLGEARLFADRLDHQAFVATPIELDIEDRLPRPEIQLALGNRHDDLVMHEHVLEMSIAVVLAAPVMAIVAWVGQQLAGGVVGRSLPGGRSDLVEPLEGIGLDAWLVVVGPESKIVIKGLL
jgi:hypothetical protein